MSLSRTVERIARRQGSYQGAWGLCGPARNKVCSVLEVHSRAWPRIGGPLRERTLGLGPAFDGPVFEELQM